MFTKLHDQFSLLSSLSECNMWDFTVNGTVDYDELCLFVGYRIVMKNLENELDQFIQALDADGM